MFIKAVSRFSSKGSGKRTGLHGLVERRRQRRALARLTPRLLSDIGVSPQQAADEAANPFWDVPGHWRR